MNAKKIAVVGAGIAGLAVAFLLQRKGHSVTLYDRKGVGGGASGVAAGLLHPFTGKRASPPAEAMTGLDAALALMRQVDEEAPFLEATPIFRPALTPQQRHDYSLSAEGHNNDIDWIEEEECSQLFPQATPRSGIVIRGKGYVVQMRGYLEALLRAFERWGGTFTIGAIDDISQLNNYDTTVLCTGDKLPGGVDSRQVAVNALKGQLLLLEWPEGVTPLPMPINGDVYLLQQGSDHVVVGATFERDYVSEDSDIDAAKKLLLPKCIAMVPALADAAVVDCFAALRATTPSRRPLVTRLTERLWYFGGLGSKGLLYHALYARRVMKEVSVHSIDLVSYPPYLV